LKNSEFDVLKSNTLKNLGDSKAIMLLSELATAANLLKNFISDNTVTTCKDIDYFLNSEDYENNGPCN